MGKSAAVVLDLGGTSVKGGVVDLKGKILARDRIPTGDRSFEKVSDTLTEFVNDLKNQVNGQDIEILGVGVASPGGVHNDRATISQSPNFPGWLDVNLCHALEKRGIDGALLENDANLAALGENWLGIGGHYKDMAMFTLGTGVGGGLILNRKIWRGEWGMAGELGHITIDPKGPQCGCGNYGCLEAFANIDGIVRETEARLSNGQCPLLRKRLDDGLQKITPLAVYEAAKSGDQDCADIFALLGKYLGIAAASLLNVLNVPLIVIGGGVGNAYDLIESSLKQEIRKRAFRVPGSQVRIERAVLGNEAGFLGAARLVFQQFATKESEVGGVHGNG